MHKWIFTKFLKACKLHRRAMAKHCTPLYCYCNVRRRRLFKRNVQNVKQFKMALAQTYNTQNKRSSFQSRYVFKAVRTVRIFFSFLYHATSSFDPFQSRLFLELPLCLHKFFFLKIYCCSLLQLVKRLTKETRSAYFGGRLVYRFHLHWAEPRETRQKSPSKALQRSAEATAGIDHKVETNSVWWRWLTENS